MMRGLLGIVLIGLALLVGTSTANHKYIYGIMVDAGSSGSRIYIYEWLHRNNNTLPNLATAPLNQTQWSKKVTPGLSTFKSNLTGIASYLAPLVQFAKDNIPTTEYSETPIFLKATGGLRALSQSDQDNIMASTRTYFATTPFYFSSTYASVIPLEAESTFGWIAANYLYGLTNAADGTVGALDMGGASTEIAFVADSTPLQSSQNVSLGDGYNYKVFATGFNARGQDDAFLITNLYLTSGQDITLPVYNPCYNVGWNETTTNGYTMIGTGNVTACRIVVNAALINTSVACPVAPCSFEGHYQPTLPAIDFFAYSAFAYTYQVYFGTNTTLTKTSLSTFDTANVNFCGRTYADIRASFTVSQQSDAFLRRYCWSGSYFTQLLSTYGFQPSVSNIYFGTSIKNIEITWALGAMLYESSLLPPSANPVLTGSSTSTTTTSSTTTSHATTGSSSSTTSSSDAVTGSSSSSTTTLLPPLFFLVAILAWCLL